MAYTISGFELRRKEETANIIFTRMKNDFISDNEDIKFLLDHFNMK